MDDSTKAKLSELEAKIDAIWFAVEKVRKYMLITAWVTVVLFVLPLVGLIFIIPAFLNSYLNLLGGI